MAIITGQTNGSASSEFKLATVAIAIFNAVVTLLAGMGYISAEQGVEWSMHFTGLVTSVYIGGRSAIKTALAAKGEAPKG